MRANKLQKIASKYNSLDDAYTDIILDNIPLEDESGNEIG
jgi:hypothetical protein